MMIQHPMLKTIKESCCSSSRHSLMRSSHIADIEPRNHTWVVEFLLLGLSEDPGLQPLIFMLFLSMYLVTVSGNLLIVISILSDPHIHMPMYFFLANLCMVKICFTSTTIPKMLVNIQTQSSTISYADCITQMFLFLFFVALDNFLLIMMAYDLFLAICHPLHYMVIMNPHLCVQLILVCWIISVLPVLNSLLVLRLSFCKHQEIPHFFCELNQLIHRAYSDTFLNDLMMYLGTVLLAGGPLAGILYSYSKITSSICAISSAQGKYEAFSTGTSHLSVVSLFYGTGLGVYLSSAAVQNSHSTAAASVMYTMVTPMLNPFIYSLRNNDIQRAVKKHLRKIFRWPFLNHSHKSGL